MYHLILILNVPTVIIIVYDYPDLYIFNFKKLTFCLAMDYKMHSIIVYKLYKYVIHKDVPLCNSCIY